VVFLDGIKVKQFGFPCIIFSPPLSVLLRVSISIIFVVLKKKKQFGFQILGLIKPLYCSEPSR